MSKWAEWKQEEYDLLGQLIKDGLTNREISEIIERPFAAIAIKAQRIFGGNPNYRMKITKHKHIRKDVMTYFLNHTAEQTKDKFKLTQSEFKSVCTISYKIPELKHLRKDKRRHDAWSAKEFKFMLQHSGLMPRDWIAKKLKRGGHEAVRGKLELLNISSRTINGITISQFRVAFQKEPGFYLSTKAGPNGGITKSSHFKIIPWVYLNQEIKIGNLQAPRIFIQLVESMALFQEWIFEGNALNKMKIITRKTEGNHGEANV